MRRLTTTVFVAVAVMLLNTTAALGHATERTNVKFKLTSDTCPKLRAGTTIKGSGRQESVTKTITNATGTKTVVNYTRTRGTARNQRGVSYKFDYSNSFAVSNTLENPALYAGTMFDTFELVRGEHRALYNGFVATYTTDLAQAATYTPLYAFGDPIDFTKINNAPGTARCDPL